MLKSKKRSEVSFVSHSFLDGSDFATQGREHGPVLIVDDPLESHIPCWLFLSLKMTVVPHREQLYFCPVHV